MSSSEEVSRRNIINSRNQNRDKIDDGDDDVDQLLKDQTIDDDSKKKLGPIKRLNKKKMLIVALGLFLVFLPGLMYLLLRSKPYPFESKFHPEANEIYKNRCRPMQRNQRIETLSMLCKLSNRFYCRNTHPADVVDRFAAVTIIYSSPFFPPSKIPLLYKYTPDFQSYMMSIGLTACLLETKRSDEEYTMTIPDKEPQYVQLINNQKFFKRDNLLNVAIKRLIDTTDLEYFTWIDAHQIFSNPYWWEESIVKIEKHGTLQLFQYIRYYGPINMTNQQAPILAPKSEDGVPPIGIGTMYELSVFDEMHKDAGLPVNGNAWAIRKEVFNKIGYIFDEAIGGLTDQGFAMASRFNGHIPWDALKADNYKKVFVPYLKRVVPILNNTGGFVRGGLTHIEHERVFNYGEFTKYINRTFAEKSLGTSLRREKDLSLTLVDDDLAQFLDFLYSNPPPKQ